MTGQNSLPLQDLKNNPNAVNVTMGDDSNVNVPLGFTFPFFGQKFTNSWMYSNGAVSFQGPNAPGGFCCSGLDLTKLTDNGYNYSITPLWTDLIAIQGGSHYRLGTPTSMTYGWYGVSEYADPSKRSSFELKIDSSGGVDVRFSGALVSYHNVTSGMIGDISKGEYYQNHFGYGFNTTGLTWTTLAQSPPPPEDPCKTNPYALNCPLYFAPTTSTPITSVVQPTAVTEPIVTQPVVTQTASVVEQPTQTTATSSPVATPVAQASQSTAVSVIQPVVQTVQPVVQSPATKTSSVSLSTVLSIVSKEQSRIAETEKTVVQEAVSTALSASQNATQQAEAVAQQQSQQSSQASQMVQNTQQRSTSTQTQNTSVVQINNPGMGAINPVLSARQVQSFSFDSTQASVYTPPTQSIDTRNLPNFRSNQTTETTAITSPVQSYIQQNQFSRPILEAPVVESNYTPPSAPAFVPQQSRQTEYVAPTIQVQDKPTVNPFAMRQQEVMMPAVEASRQEQTSSTQTYTYTPPRQIEAPRQEQTATVTYAPLMVRQENRVTEPVVMKTESFTAGDRNVITQQIENRQVLTTTTVQPQQTTAVNRTAADSSVAAGVSIASIATQPRGYDSYFGMMQDAKFYEPKEIYKNQRTVDNARVLRGLMSGSDRLHQQMVEQQYGR